MERIISSILLLLSSILPLSSMELGYASWYGTKFQGRLTASGEVFDTNELTAAHKTLPFGTIVKVTNLTNSKSVEVRINDRGPFVEGRIIDLSLAAADKIEMTGMGVAKVKVEVIKEGDGKRYTPDKAAGSAGIKDPPAFLLQVGAYSGEVNAMEMREKLSAEGLPAELEELDNGIIRVVIPAVNNSMKNLYVKKCKEIGITEILIRVP